MLSCRMTNMKYKRARNIINLRFMLYCIGLNSFAISEDNSSVDTASNSSSNNTHQQAVVADTTAHTSAHDQRGATILLPNARNSSDGSISQSSTVPANVGGVIHTGVVTTHTTQARNNRLGNNYIPHHDDRLSPADENTLRDIRSMDYTRRRMLFNRMTKDELEELAGIIARLVPEHEEDIR